MLTITANWLYILLTAFCSGYAFLVFAEKLFNYRVRRVDGILVSGLVIATVYAQFFSLFGGVGLCANGIFLLFCLAVPVVWHRQIFSFLRERYRESAPLFRILAVALFFLWVYFTSRGYMHYDSDLYHAQSIRWIEEYGVVKGLGNLHVRFAYNSAAFAANALYGFAFLTGRSLHTVNGFWAFLLSVTVLDIGGAWRRKKLLLSDYARAAAIYYLTLICDEVVAPASDYTITCTVFYIVIRWLSLAEEDEKKEDATPYALLCVAGVYAVTLKLTAGLILILTILPACRLIQAKKWRDTGIFLLLGVATALPWVIRTVVISGWLLYPFPQLDLFSFDWKMSAGTVAQDAAEIRAWARGIHDPSGAGMSVGAWFAGWFARELTLTEKAFVCADLLGCAVTAAAAIRALVRRKRECLPELLTLGTVLCSYLFWQLSAPMIRYGYAYVLLLAALSAGLVLRDLRLDRVVCAALILYGVYKLYTICGYITDTAQQPYYVRQQDYGVYELTPCAMDGVTIYLPAEGDRTGYASFPSVPYLPDAKLRGAGLAEGFKPR